MNQLCRTGLVATVHALAAWVFLLLGGANCFAQDYPIILQITSPADGAVVHPGQTVAVSVAPTSSDVFTAVVLTGKAPFGLTPPLYSAPYQFSITVPQRIAAGKYYLMAIGGRQGQTFGTSDPVSLDVEPAAAITKMRLESDRITFNNPGEIATLKVFGTFADGSVMNITDSTGTTYTSGDTTAVTTKSNGLVTAVGVGKYGITPVIVRYGDQQIAVQASTERLATPPAPTLSILTPTSGPVGTSVTLTGANFGASQGTSTVTFNGTLATPSSWSPSSLVVSVPNGAMTGNVVVTVGGRASNGLNFAVQSPAYGAAKKNVPRY
jgi:IPT/TIG domain-containing protein